VQLHPLSTQLETERNTAEPANPLILTEYNPLFYPLLVVYLLP